MKKHLNLIILITIVILGTFLRFYNLGSTHLGFFRDEAALGFNIWSILQNGKDEFGQTLPLFFRSFEVFFMPAYVYLSTPIVFLFGLTEFSTRFLSALSGSLLILVSYLISKELFKSEKIGLFGSAIVAFSPWSIFYSRGTFEGNLCLLFFSLGFYFWLKFKNTFLKKFYFLSIFVFVLSMYSYQAPRLVVPVFLIFSILFTKNWTKNFKLWISGAIFALFLYLPILIFSASPAGYHRALGVSIFTNQTQVPLYNENLGKWQNLYLVPREIASLYLHYFSPNNLFIQGDYNLQRKVTNFSVFYLWYLPLLLLGIYKIIKTDFKGKKELLFWLFIAPVPAALTKDPFHTYRAILFWIPLSLIIALGFKYLLDLLKKYELKILLTTLILLLFSLASFFYNLFKITPVFYSREWDYGYSEIVNFVKEQPENLRIVVDDLNTQPYIFFLFYRAISLEEYQKVAFIGSDYYQNSDRLRPEKVGRFEFRKVDWPTERGDKNTLFIFPYGRLYPSEFSGDPKLILAKIIYAPNGEPAFYLVQNIDH